MNSFPSKRLVYSSFIFLYPCLFYLYSSIIEQTTTHSSIQDCFFILILVQFLLSVSFWLPNRPVLWIQRTDAFLAKMNAFLFSLYVLWIKPLSFSVRSLYLVILILMCVSFYGSDHYSRQQWACDSHLNWHLGMHLFGTLATSMVFL